MTNVPDRPTLEGLEDKWSRWWEDHGTYRFDRSAPRDRVFAIDTPPPTVSGSLHVGHIFSYTHTDAVARYHRMRGEAVFYPMGWDDNGLPTERRVQNYFGVACDPHLPYDPDFEPPETPGKRPVHISRPNFVELCLRLTEVDEKAFEELFRHVGLSVDWSYLYATIDENSRRTSQAAFLRNLARGEAYQAEAPTIWDVGFQTAVAQAEIEDRERPGAYHRIAFERADGSGPPVEIETTRPVLIPACVALVAHPDDERYADLFGRKVLTPIFDVEVEVHPHPLADPDKGSGIAMICTFGDTTDVTWWRELDLPTRSIIGRNGRLVEVEWGTGPWASRNPGRAGEAYAELAGKTIFSAEKRMVEMLAESGALRGEPRPITHPVKFFEKGDRPLEIVTSRQWYIRNGGRDEDLRRELLARGEELHWHPEWTGARYRDWVSGLNGDWLISRQRFFGVPFPVWYRIGPDGEIDHDGILLPSEEDLPVDPSTDVPPGHTPEQRDRPGGFTGDPDVMDTWATSSLSPQIAGRWLSDPDLWDRVFPMKMRPQSHEIIRTWLFATVVRSHFEHHCLPWSDAAISGWILDPDRKKMSKSKGNVVTPMDLLEKHGSDAVRYWALSGRPGVDTAFDEGQMKVGRRLAIKLLNVSKFVLNLSGGDDGSDGDGEITEPVDRALLAELVGVVATATEAFEGFDYARALERTEAFFWGFCDNYVELVKARAYGEGGERATASGRHTLRVALSTVQRLFAPFLAFTAEEVWSWWREGSVHTQAWPSAPEIAALAGDGDPRVYTSTAAVLGEIRRAKTEAKRSLRTPVRRVVVSDNAEGLAPIRSAGADLSRAGHIADLQFHQADNARVEVTLEPED